MKPALTLADFANAAAQLGVDVPTIQAVTDVESSGRGFLVDGRPKILFERHVMYRQLLREAGVGEATFLAKQHPAIINPQPGGYAKGPTSAVRMAAEWDRLAGAISVNRQCALESASWGLFQIMGYHWETLRYANVQAFVNAMYRDEAGQLDAFVRFVRADTALHRALLAHDWTTFARRYNGPATRGYDIKLARAYETHVKSS